MAGLWSYAPKRTHQRQLCSGEKKNRRTVGAPFSNSHATNREIAVTKGRIGDQSYCDLLNRPRGTIWLFVIQVVFSFLPFVGLDFPFRAVNSRPNSVLPLNPLGTGQSQARALSILLNEELGACFCPAAVASSRNCQCHVLVGIPNRLCPCCVDLRTQACD